MNIAAENTVLGFDYWGIHQETDKRFRLILRNVLGLMCLLFIGLPFWIDDPLSEIEKIEPEEYFLEIVQPAPVVKPKVTVVKAAEKKVETPKPVTTAKKVQAPAAQRSSIQSDTAAAKKIASTSGVMAFSEQLAMLRNTDAKTISSNMPLRDRGIVAEETQSSTNVLSTSARGVNGGVDNGKNVSDQGSKIAIGKHSTKEIFVAAGGSPGAAQGKSNTLSGGPQGRSLEEIQLAFDRSKSAFYAIFNRAARSDSSIGAGTVVVSLTIQPDGTVSDCSVVTSSFFNADLKAKLVQRVKQIKFERKDVPVFLYESYPISYVPR